jgi:superfamily II DNA or RNA helicase
MPARKTETHLPSRLAAALQPGAVLTLEREPAPAKAARGNSDTVPADATTLERNLERAFAESPALFLLELGLSDPAVPLHPSLGFWRAFAADYPRRLLLLPGVETLRERAELPPDEGALQGLLASAPPMAGAEYLDGEALRRHWEALHALFQARIKSFAGSVEDWINSLPGLAREIGRIHFHLVENREGDLPFAFIATYGHRVGRRGRLQHVPLRHALEEFRNDAKRQIEVLKSIYRAAEGSPWLKQLVETGDVFHPLGWTPTQAHRFLMDVEVITEAGILCRIPDWWRSARQGARVKVLVGEHAKEAGLGMEALVDFKPEISLDGEVLSEAELRRLAEAGEELAFIKGRWVAVDGAKIKAGLELFQRARRLSEEGELSVAEALRMLAGTAGGDAIGLEEGEAELAPGAWLSELLEKLKNPALVRSVSAGPGFHGKLRPYQQLGVNWLHFLHTLGFGGCLADDMGLGKTVQVLAFLQALKDKAQSESLGTLLVVPASLLHNWIAEAARFTPRLVVEAFHPAFPEPSGGADVTVTTYGVAGRAAAITEKSWKLVILDEAQAIKNPASRQARAVKALRTSRRLVLTGTPIENRLFDLWSLFDFLNPGLLGAADAFRRRARAMQASPEGYARLRQAVQPYILRRLKTDKALIPDLPDKVERKVYAGLAKKQVALYRNLVRKLEAALEGATGMARKGMILAFLTRFKQVCNHPDHYSGAGGWAENDSGKFALLREICEPISDKRERVLVFSQFAEIADPLAEYLAGLFGKPGLVLTGRTSVARRRAVVEAFQGDDYAPFMVLSLKAGGTGLNLTRANHVIHFDRWWNPAVENQATDRAFRLGQTKNVVVHKFITRGTVEEKIDALIESKLALARDVIPGGSEEWITEMSDDQVVDLFKLGAAED